MWTSGLCFMKRIIKSSTLLIVGLILTSCNAYKGVNLKSGDLIFVTAKRTGLSAAINNVTQKQKEANYDHVGIISKENNRWVVYHAAPKGGSQKQALVEFDRDRSKEGQKVCVYRLKKDYRKSIPEALNKAEQKLNKPYNFDYVLNEDSYYCSDYVERAFRKNRIFKLEPMTFKDPKTGETDAYWKSFYEKKNMKVPEGELGCNPNGLAASEKLEKKGCLK